MPAPKKEAASKKTTSKKIVSVKKSAPKAPSSVKSAGFFNWEQWTNVFADSLSCWKQIIGRYILILIITLGLQFGGVIALSVLIFGIIGGPSGLENVLANIQVGTVPAAPILMGSIGVIILWFLYAVTIGMISKIAFLSLIKDSLNENRKSAVSLIFTEGKTFLLRYLGLALKILFYLAWPLVLVTLLYLAWDISLYLYPNNALSGLLSSIYIGFFFAITYISALIYLIISSVRVLYALPALIQTDKSVSETFAIAKAITYKAWWFTALMWGLFIVLLYAVNIILGIVATFDPIILFEALEPNEALRLTDLLAFLLSLFIFGPITTAFQYLLMLQTAKNQSVKL